MQYGNNKTEGFPSKVTDAALVFKALGHPARLAIMEYLANSTSCICNDIVDQIPLAQPTISRHLSELKKVGLILGTIEGKNTCYCIDQKRWAELKKLINEFCIPQNNVTQSC